MSFRRCLVACLLLLAIFCVTVPLAAAPPRYLYYDLGDLSSIGHTTDYPALNNRDQVVGCCFRNGNYRAYLWTAQDGPHDLGNLGTGTKSWAYAINDKGQVAGFSAINGDQGERAFVWTAKDGMKDLGGVYLWAEAMAINNKGLVIGVANTSTQVHLFFWTAKHGMQDLNPTAPSDWYYAAAVNNKGQVMGYWHTVYHGFFWSAQGGWHDLGNLGGDKTQPLALNNKGQVVGWATVASGEWDSRAFLWTAKDGIQNLGLLPGATYSSANGINNKGQVVGECWDNIGAIDRAFLWTAKHGMQDLGTLSGSWSGAQAINNHGQVVGWASLSGDQTWHAFLWTAQDGMQDLNDLVTNLPSGVVIMGAGVINDRGTIIGKTSDDRIFCALVPY